MRGGGIDERDKVRDGRGERAAWRGGGIGLLDGGVERGDAGSLENGDDAHARAEHGGIWEPGRRWGFGARDDGEARGAAVDGEGGGLDRNVREDAREQEEQ